MRAILLLLLLMFKSLITTRKLSVPEYAHGYFSWNFSWAFVPIEPINVRTKFKVHSLTHSWDNRGYSKICAVPGYAHAPFCPKFWMDFCSDGPCQCTGQIWSR